MNCRPPRRRSEVQRSEIQIPPMQKCGSRFLLQLHPQANSAIAITLSLTKHCWWKIRLQGEDWPPPFLAVVKKIIVVSFFFFLHFLFTSSFSSSSSSSYSSSSSSSSYFSSSTLPFPPPPLPISLLLHYPESHVHQSSMLRPILVAASDQHWVPNVGPTNLGIRVFLCPLWLSGIQQSECLSAETTFFTLVYFSYVELF